MIEFFDEPEITFVDFVVDDGLKGLEKLVRNGLSNGRLPTPFHWDLWHHRHLAGLQMVHATAQAV